jgi:hypothetical protein
MIMGSYEDYWRHEFCPDGVDDCKAISARHLHIEERQVRILLANTGDCFSSVSRLQDGFDLRLPAEQSFQPIASEWLVIHDENS